ncbi:DNA polymerase III subunit gamma/tau [Microbacterium mangrovi]|uniref:DNA-directed DNA polymerase n=1 Tax=Microbacterium mangrovi TaxID=1348253 RepID=A0A0B2A8L1_9MICO|nr:DNA polymerase III subunit gamma and tau [Microbacterium mangrovi]KHK97857.1 DNA polymerase III subunit gamma/tau [Microbacterium mangrovi]
MTAALYRRYRPESFAEMIGQAQVTEPLMTALRGDRVGHAYLFSGPRGCGKTTSARILARCLNCAQGPTDTPCGVCDSCRELGRGGGGSLDVVEIDAASHNGVDDARDLRERAVFAPARDRFKIFILDEAHMVTPQGFNALLKLVEEPPDHVKFIFATTEPEKVIGTIRSRTHHYPFRLVAPAAMLEYVGGLCEQEGVRVEPGVLPLVVRAGGGSPRDTLSLLDQLIAGSDPADGGGVTVRYDRAVALLGYTPAELLDEVVDAFAGEDAAAAFNAVDRVVQTGQDPRRFVDDLLERLRDLIVIAATGAGAASVLRGVPADELQRMTQQAEQFGSARLSRIADIVVTTLDEMTGATSPRLQLELMIARVLARGGAGAASAPPPVVERAKRDETRPPAEPAPAQPAAAHPAAAQPTAAEPPAAPPAAAQPPVVERPSSGSARSGTAERDETRLPAESPTPAAAQPPVAEPAPSAPAPAASGPVDLDRMRGSWPQVLTALEGISRPSWMLVIAANVASLDGDVLTLTFASASDVAKFKQRPGGPSEDLRTAIEQVLGLRVKYIARQDGPDGPGGPGGSGPSGSGPRSSGPDAGPAPDAPPRDPAPRDRSPRDEPRRDPWADAPPPADATPPADEPRPAEAGAPTARSAAPMRASTTAPVMTAPAPRPVDRDLPPVTDWAVAAIPSGPAPGLAVDDDPDDDGGFPPPTDADAPPADGDVLPADVVETSLEPADEDERYADEVPVDRPIPPTVVPAQPPAPAAQRAPEPAAREASRRPATGGIQRYGEAVVRQMLGATFVREEPYETGTRFN